MVADVVGRLVALVVAMEEFSVGLLIATFFPYYFDSIDLSYKNKKIS